MEEPLALQKIRPLFSRLYYVTAGAVEEFFEIQSARPRLKLATTIRGASNSIYDLMRLRAKEAFADLLSQGFKWEEEQESITITTPDGMIIKFNKLNSQNRVHRPTTDRSAKFFYQPRFAFASSSDLTGLVITAAYSIDRNVSVLIDSLVQHQCGDNVEWTCSIPRPPSEDQFSMVPKSDGPQSDRPGFVVRPKKDDAQKKAE